MTLRSKPWRLAREISRRHIGMAPYAQQLMAGYALLTGAVVEMDTGEGKTLTSIVPSAIHALGGRLVHIVAPNDYLAQRDGTLLRPALEALGITVGIVIHDMSPADRRAAYGCNVTFVSNKEVAFDYLRDRLLAEESIGDRNNIHLEDLQGPSQPRTARPSRCCAASMSRSWTGSTAC